MPEDRRTSLADSGSPIEGEEFPFFFGDGLFGVVHQPTGTARSGWVICSPFGKERDNSHRLGFVWSRHLASLGYWSLRFDFRGTGDSTGNAKGASIDNYLEDISAAVNELERVSGFPCRGLFGLRLGASLAAMFVARSGREYELGMWEPVVSGRAYVNSLLRTAMANRMVHKGQVRKSRDELRQDISNGIPVAADGFALSESMCSTLSDVDLIDLGRPTSSSILIVHMKTGRNRVVPPAMTKLVEMYSSTGDLHFESVDEPPVWMRTRSYAWNLNDLFQVSSVWMTERGDAFGTGRLGGPVSFPSVAQSGAAERPVGFMVDGERVWGILHEPAEPRREAQNIILVAAGEACRSSFFYPQLARALADDGWGVLRFDPRGVGDSHGHLGNEVLIDIFTSVENGRFVPDTSAALDFMEQERGLGPSLLIGLCGGAITAIWMAQSDDRVKGIVPLELPMRLTQPPDLRKKNLKSDRLPWHEALSQRQSTLFLLMLRRMYHTMKDYRRRASLSLNAIVPWRSRGADWFRKKNRG